MENDKITGIPVLDTIIKQKGLKHWIKFLGWIGILLAVVGIGHICLFYLGKDQYLARWGSFNIPIWIGYYGIYQFFAIAPLSMIAGIGLLKMKQWGRQLFLLNMLLLLINNILNLTTKNTGSLFSMVLWGAVIYFLSRPKVKEQFRLEEKGPLLIVRYKKAYLYELIERRAHGRN